MNVADKKPPAFPMAQRARGGENVLFGAKVRARIAKSGGEVDREIDPDTSGRVRLLPDRSQVAMGGELVPAEAELRDTVTNPDYVTLDASHDRLNLASLAGTLELALDVSDTIDAANSLEKMLAHQMAVVHRALMKTAISWKTWTCNSPASCRGSREMSRSAGSLVP